MKRILTIIAFMAVICNCQSQDEPAQDQECANHCQWQIGNRQAGICCPSTAPYCGVADTNCGVGRCCSSIPLNLSLHPND